MTFQTSRSGLSVTPLSPLWSLLAVGFCWLAAVAVPAHAADRKYDLFGDVRFRLEADWDSRRADGSERDDRERARVRGRIGVDVRPKAGWQLGARLRTGSRASQQSPHVTVLDFDSNPTGDRDVLLDQWFVRAERDGSWGWVGRNSFPFWKQNEMFWDDDVTAAGIALGHELGISGLSVVGGYLALPDGGVDFNGRLLGGQLIYSKAAASRRHTFAGGVFLFEGDTRAMNSRSGNGERDYTIWVGSYQAQSMGASRPWRLGLDWMHNSESYSASDPDPFTAAHRDDRDGLALSVSRGQTNGAGDWLVAYTYAYIETFAVHASYAQDDWVRWGSATQTDSSDLEGHELRFSLGLTGESNLNVRLFLVEAISSAQDGKRIRLDYNRKF